MNKILAIGTEIAPVIGAVASISVKALYNNSKSFRNVISSTGNVINNIGKHFTKINS